MMVMVKLIKGLNVKRQLQSHYEFFKAFKIVETFEEINTETQIRNTIETLTNI